MNSILPKGPLLAAFILLTVIAVSAVAFLGIAVFLNAPTGKTAGAVLDIPKGATARGVAQMLREKEIIRSEFFFCLVSRANGYSSRFKAGRFRFPREMRTTDIARFLADTPPGPVDIRVTIPEGYNIREIASVLQKKAGVDSASFTMFAMSSSIAESLGVDNKTLEGYLYPETYFIAERSRSLDVIRRMAAQFREVFADSLKTRAKTLGMTVNEVVTLASLVETEAANAGERPIVSQVFHRRLELGYPLQANPTIQYILGEKRRVLTEDLNIESPYNTYLHKGLPPGPIANPGIGSIHAALYPADTRYLYFVSDGEGGHIFSETLDEHNSAVAKYLRKRNGKTD
jgi:UPF0755 protein